jgi:hypothetical protein
MTVIPLATWAMTVIGGCNAWNPSGFVTDR